MQKTNMTALEDNLKRILTVLLFITGSVLISAQKDSLSVENKDPDIVSHSELTKEPEFPGGSRAFKESLSTEIQHSNFKNTEIIKAYVWFTVNEEGKMTNIKVHSPYEDIKQELLKVFQKINSRYTWSPGEANGQKIKSRMRQPITIHPFFY